MKKSYDQLKNDPTFMTDLNNAFWFVLANAAFIDEDLLRKLDNRIVDEMQRRAEWRGHMEQLRPMP